MEGTVFSPGTPAEVPAAANALLGSLDEVLWAAKSPDELVDTVAACEALRSHLAGLHRGPGRAAVRHAKILAGDRSLTRQALRDGLVSPEQAAVTCDAV